MTPRTHLAGRAAGLDAARTPFVWATVVRAERPTSAKPGDSALVTPDGRIEGFVGGACAEATVRAQALEVLAAGNSRLVRIMPGGSPRGEERAGEVTVVNPCLSGGTLEIFLEPEIPPPLVVVFGEGPVARALQRAGAASDQQVHLCAEPPGPPPPDTSAVVVASHGRSEEQAIRAALDAGVPYVGLVASRRRGTAVLDGMGLSDEERVRVHTPAGLDIGAHTPGEVALSILAEIVSLRPPRPVPAGIDPGPGLEEVVAAGPGEATVAAVVDVTGEAPAAPTSAVDPVCGMTVAAVDASLHADDEGRRVWFCGPGCRDAYIDAPARYRS